MNSWYREAAPRPARVCLVVISSLFFLALPGQAAQALSVEIEATPRHVDRGGSSTLRWRSTGAKWCYSRGVWGSGRGLQGSFDTGRLWRKTWYGITCSNGWREVSDSVTVVVRERQPELSVSLSATPLHVDRGGSSRLQWSSTGAAWCYSRGVWGAGRPRQGGFDTGRLWRNTWYGITCSDGTNEVSDSVTVVVRDAPPELSVNLSATPGQVGPGGSSTLQWTSTGAAWCYSRGVWGGGRNVQGTFNTGRLWNNTWYGITCSDGVSEVSDAVTVAVREDDRDVPVIRWRAPTRNEDGSALWDLSGYRLYWGTSSRNYSSSANIDSPDATQYTPDHLPAGTYYMAVTALDREGNESGYSNEIQVRIP